MPDDLSAETAARRKSGRRRTEKASERVPTAMLALMSVLAVSGAGLVWYFSGKNDRPPPATVSTQADRSHSSTSAPTSWHPPPPSSQAAGTRGPDWVDLAEGDGPPPTPPEDRTANMILIPAGKFLYGEENEELDLPAFYIDRCEVSQAEYAQFLRYIRLKGDHSH